MDIVCQGECSCCCIILDNHAKTVAENVDSSLNTVSNCFKLRPNNRSVIGKLIYIYLQFTNTRIF